MLKQFFLQGMAFVSGCDITDPILQPLADGEQSFKCYVFATSVLYSTPFYQKVIHLTDVIDFLPHPSGDDDQSFLALLFL